jgi:hypothetical protein
MNLKRVLWTALTITTLVLTAAFLRPVTSVVTAQADRVGICHRTGSDTNPYVFIEVSRNAVPAHIGADAHPPLNGRADFLASGPEACVVTTTTTTTTATPTTTTTTATPTITTTTTTPTITKTTITKTTTTKTPTITKTTTTKTPTITKTTTTKTTKTYG